MITLSSIPHVNLARDPLFVTFITDNYKQSNGAAAYQVFKLTSLPSANDTLTISTSDGKQWVFTFVAEPDDSGLQIETPPAGQTIDDYTQSYIYPALLANYTLFEFATIDYAVNLLNVTITAREKAFNPITVTANGFTIQGVYGGNGSAEVYRENFKINYQLYSTDTDLPISGIRSLEPNALGKLDVDIHKLIEGLANNTFIFDAANVVEPLPNDIYRVYIKYWESYGLGTAFTNRKTKNSSSFNLIEAASSFIDQAELNEQGKTWIDTVGTRKPVWLTKKPQVCSILPDQKVLLKIFARDFLVYYDQTLLTIRKTDVNGVITKQQITITDDVKLAIYQFDVSPNRLNIGNNIASYEVFIEGASGGEPRTDVLTFKIDRTYYNNIRQYFFRNSLGGFDTIQGVGIGKTDADYKRERASVNLPNKHVRTDRETKVISVEEKLDFKANLGFGANWGEGKHAWANYIRNLYSTEEAFEIINEVLYPIDITTSKAPLVDDNNHLPDYTLEYTRAYVERGAPSKIPALQGAYTNQYTEQYD